MASIHDPHFTAAFGIIGNILSFLVYLSPIPTFYRIVKKKSTEGFQSIPYSVALFSAMLLLYYAFIKKNAFMLITINSVGVLIESSYLIVYMIYATTNARLFTTKLLVFFNMGALGAIVLLTYIFTDGSLRVNIVGFITAIFSVCVFAAPLSIIRLVIRTQSVEYMPFGLSFFLTLCAVTWFFYGYSLSDFYIATPNILGFAFGIGQMILYTVYRSGKKNKEFLAETISNYSASDDKPCACPATEQQDLETGVQMAARNTTQILPSNETD